MTEKVFSFQECADVELKSGKRDIFDLSHETDFDRFWGFVSIPTDVVSGCWLWTGPKNNGLYGQISFNRKALSSHRCSWEYFNGPIPGGMVVRHYECGNPSCVNPAHLKIGTQADNMRDRIKDGTLCVGERNGRAKISEADVVRARNMKNAGVSLQKIANEIGVCKSSIQRMVSGRTWRHV